jgi:hypothetical protein
MASQTLLQPPHNIGTIINRATRDLLAMGVIMDANSAFTPSLAIGN